MRHISRVFLGKKKIVVGFVYLTIYTSFSLQRSLKEQIEVYSKQHFSESDPFDHNASRVICFVLGVTQTHTPFQLNIGHRVANTLQPAGWMTL